MSPHRCHGIDDTIVQWIHPHAAVTLRVRCGARPIASRAIDSPPNGREIMVLALSLTNDLYLRRLRVLGAWWCLGSSSVEPELLIEYEAVAERKAA